MRCRCRRNSSTCGNQCSLHVHGFDNFHRSLRWDARSSNYLWCGNSYSSSRNGLTVRSDRRSKPLKARPNRRNDKKRSSGRYAHPSLGIPDGSRMRSNYWWSGNLRSLNRNGRKVRRGRQSKPMKARHNRRRNDIARSPGWCAHR